ncbi:MAG: MFS transporter [Alphaproteobacteria bacterium]|jgi:MFS family permease|nr:MFS transporter [Alphaproteobacteria bacterium]
MNATASKGRSDALVVGLVGLVHLLSHFYQIALGPLFPLLRAEFEVSYTALGLIVSLFYGVSGACQAFVGILVDRYGAHRLLLFGIATMATAVLLMGFVSTYWMLLPLAVMAAFGNSVFHPADLSILSHKVSPERTGRAFAIHGFGGTCGYFLSPIVIYYGVASFAGWRAGLITAGVIGWLAALLIYRYRDALRMPARGIGTGHAMPGLTFYIRLVTNLPLMAAFCFFALIAVALAGMQSFSVTALVEIYDAPLYIATAGLTAYLGGSAAGILFGGELADRFRRHALIATSGMALGATFMACVAAFQMPMPAVIAALAAVGFCVSSTNPSRDILVRAATPAGATGKVFGFVYSGLDLGGALGPLLFGWLMDGGQFRGVFVAIAAMYFFAIVSVLQLKRGQQTAAAAAD